MKRTWMIILTSLALWLMQVVLFVLLLTMWFSHNLVSSVAFPGLPSPDTPLQAFISHLLKILLYPVCLILPENWRDKSSITMVLSLGADSVFWGLIVGMLIHAFRKRSQQGSSA